jgi:hypothetical protein
MNLASQTSVLGGASPEPAAQRPQRSAYILPLVLVALGCATDAQVTKPAIVGMSSTTAPYYSDGNTTIYEVETSVMLPMRAPTSDEKSKLGPAPTYLQSFGATKAPWILASDVQTTLTITLTNVDNQQNIVELLVDPWNEYVIYKPGIEVVDDETTLPDLSGFDRQYTLAPQQRMIITLVPDDTNAMATNLATVMNVSVKDPMDPNGNGLFNHAMDLQNRPLSSDPLLQSYVPATTDIPAMVGFDIGLRSLATMNVALEVSVDVQDTVGGKVLPTNLDANNKPLPPPTATISPPKVTPAPAN